MTHLKKEPEGFPQQKQPVPADNSMESSNTLPLHNTDFMSGGLGKPELEEKNIVSPVVTLPKVDSPTTPATMTKSRIPPRIDIPLQVDASATGAELTVETQGGGNGTVTLNGKLSLNLIKGKNLINLKGGDQTEPGNADKLKLVARKGAKVLATSNTFSVAAIPQNWSSELIGPASAENPDYVGIHIMNKWESDSNDVTDLGKVMRKEQSVHTIKTGPFAPALARVSSYVAANTGAIEDRHRIGPRANFREKGANTTTQMFVFKDERTGVSEIPATNSGFLITRDITADPKAAHGYKLHVTKKGATVNNPYSTTAGTANIDETYDV